MLFAMAKWDLAFIRVFVFLGAVQHLQASSDWKGTCLKPCTRWILQKIRRMKGIKTSKIGHTQSSKVSSRCFQELCLSHLDCREASHQSWHTPPMNYTKFSTLPQIPNEQIIANRMWTQGKLGSVFISGSCAGGNCTSWVPVSLDMLRNPCRLNRCVMFPHIPNEFTCIKSLWQ